VESQPVDAGNDAVLALLRRHPAGVLLQLYNVSERWQHVPAWVARRAGLYRPWDRISSFAPLREGLPAWSGTPESTGDDGWYALPPYAAWWLADRGVVRAG
jgi:hypothetical protein